MATPGKAALGRWGLDKSSPFKAVRTGDDFYGYRATEQRVAGITPIASMLSIIAATTDRTDRF